MKRTGRGFTVSELLIVVAILGLLLSLAIPSAVAVRNKMNLARLDHEAREIFLAAQNHLIGRRAAGTLDEVELGEEEGGCFWVTDTHPQVQRVLPAGGVDPQTAAEHFAIFYHADSATVLEVYVSGHPLPDQGQIRSLYGEDRGDARREDGVGFYCGEDISLPEGEALQLHPALIEIENGDELTVRVDAPRNTRKTRATLTAEVARLGGGGEPCGPWVQVLSEPIRLSSHRFTLTLDSLARPELRFSQRCPGISPGSDIRVRVTIRGPEGEKLLPSVAWKDTNSLFASHREGRVQIETARHLQNLARSVSGVEGITQAEQVEDILWPEDQTLQPITNPQLAEYDGNQRLIVQLNSTGGLFGTVNRMELTGVRLVAPKITGGTGAAGALAAETADTRITDCRTYAVGTMGRLDPAGEASVVSGRTAGGLVGKAGPGTVILRSFAALPQIRGGTVGGLVGVADGAEITGCYAATGRHSPRDGSSDWIGGLSGENRAGGLVGSARNSGVNSCFALGFAPLEGTAPLCGGTAAVTGSYWALEGAQSCGYVRQGKPVPASLEDLKALAPALSAGFCTTAPQTYTYSPACTGLYPFPALVGPEGEDCLPFYGVWPVQSVTDLKIYDRRGRELPYIMVPSGGAVTVEIRACSGAHPAEIPVSVAGGGENAASLFRWDTPVYDSQRQATSLTLDGYATRNPGVSYLDLKGEGCTVRVPVLVYRAELTLTGAPAAADEVCNRSSAADPQSESSTRAVNLKPGQQARFRAELTAAPSAPAINRGFDAIRAALPHGVRLSLKSDTVIAQEDWLGLQVARGDERRGGGPGVTVNPPVVPEEKIYVLWDGTPEREQFPLTRETERTDEAVLRTGALTVEGQSAGSAEVAVSWAMDDALTTSCPVRVSGVQVAIRSAAVRGERSGPLAGNDSYPYVLELAPRPGEDLLLELSPTLFGRAPAGTREHYVWTVTRGDKTVFGPREVNPKTAGKPVVLKLEDDAPYASYRIGLVYSYEGKRGQYTTADFMYLLVRRRTSSLDDHTNGVLCLDHAELNRRGELILEQIDWETPPKNWTGGKLNEQQLAGHVEGAEDPQLLWYLKEDAANPETRITGKTSVTVLGDDGMPAAVLSWSPAETGNSRGGTVTVTAGNNGRDGEEELSFTLCARARDNGTNETPQDLEIPVRIRPLLSLTPKSRVAAGLAGETETWFSANRRDGRFDYKWSVRRMDGEKGCRLSVPDRDHPYSALLYTESDLWSGPRTFKVTLQYGPYTQEATLTANKILKEAQFSINQDAPGLFLVEKGETRDLEFSWGSSLVNSTIVKHPDADCSGMAVVIPGEGEVPNSREGSFHYGVTGLEFSGGALEMKWDVRKTGFLYQDRVYPAFRLYVVGGEFDRSSCPKGTLTLTTDDLSRGNGAEVMFRSYFPGEVDTGAVVLNSSRPDLLAVSGPGVEPSGEGEAVYHPDGGAVDERTLTLTGLGYGTAVLSASYSVGGQVYRDSITVDIVPTHNSITPHLEFCSRQDLSRLEELFPEEKFRREDGSARPLVTCADDPKEGLVPTLFSHTLYAREGFDTIYLKAWLGRGAAALTEADGFEARFSSDNADAVDCLARPDGTTGIWYLQIRGKNGSLGGERVHITADFGPGLDKTVSAAVYSSPSVVIYDAEGRETTNRHTLIQGFDRLTHPSDHAFTGRLSPSLLARDGAGDWVPLDRLVWSLEYPAEGYGGLTLYGADGTAGELAAGDGITVHISRDPQCKVVVRAQSELARAGGDRQLALSGHALIFIPGKTG